MRIETVAVHAGAEVDPATGAVTAAIHPSTTFERDADGSFPHGHIYSRTSAPNRAALEACLTALEGGAGAVAFASASAATSAVFQSLAPGDHVVAPLDAYFGTAKLLREVYAGWGLETTLVDMTDLAAVEKAVRPATKLVWAETPSNPLWKVTDLARLGALARAAGARFVVDNTTATPVLQSPFTFGADLIVHATTKYLGGHADVLGGIVVARERGPLFDRLRTLQTAGGAVPSPFDCWLLLRGVKTLALRVERQSENAMEVAKALQGNKAVRRVFYPGLDDHPNRSVAARQMRMFGGMVSFEVADEATAFRTLERLQIFALAESLGAVESLAEHPARMTHASIPAQERQRAGVGDGLIRLSIGVEDVADLIADLEFALEPS